MHKNHLSVFRRVRSPDYNYRSNAIITAFRTWQLVALEDISISKAKPVGAASPLSSHSPSPRAKVKSAAIGVSHEEDFYHKLLLDTEVR